MATDPDVVVSRLRSLPAVHELAAAADGMAPRWAVVEAARQLVAARRAAIRGGGDPASAVSAAEVAQLASLLAGPGLRRVINATGVVLHTNLGRAPLAPAAITALIEVARGYSNLEYDLGSGARGSRHAHAEALVCSLTGAEAACVVNNNAAATLLALAALAAGREVIVSRGELVEIGGSFRIPDILRASGCTLVEVGTTNKTHRSDYEAAIRERTALLLKVHRANFAMVGFTSDVAVPDLAALAHTRGLPVMVDLGSGCLMTRDQQRALGLPDEPTVAEVVAGGADLVCFSGDKLLGGPQAGILIGTGAMIARVREHPLMRAVRPDKLTLAALCATLALYRDGCAAEIPAIAMLSASADQLRFRAEALADMIRAVSPPGLAAEVSPCESTVGGGAMPLGQLPSWAVTLTGGDRPDRLGAKLREAVVPVIARVECDRVWLDVRTVAPDEHALVVAAIAALAIGGG